MATQDRRRGPGRPFKPGNKPAAPWKPGQSGNPGGMPRTVKEIRALALEHSPAALLRLVELTRSDNEAVAERAAEAVLDRAGLKPFAVEPERLEVTHHDASDAIGRLGALLARRIAALDARSGDAGVARLPEPAGS